MSLPGGGGAEKHTPTFLGKRPPAGLGAPLAFSLLVRGDFLQDGRKQGHFGGPEAGRRVRGVICGDKHASWVPRARALRLSAQGTRRLKSTRVLARRQVRVPTRSPTAGTHRPPGASRAEGWGWSPPRRAALQTQNPGTASDPQVVRDPWVPPASGAKAIWLPSRVENIQPTPCLHPPSNPQSWSGHTRLCVCVHACAHGDHAWQLHSRGFDRQKGPGVPGQVRR